MKFYTSFIFLFLYSCKGINHPGVKINSSDKVWNIHLENNLGILQISLPKQFDTLFTWTQYSDCGDPCAKIDYRIQTKKLPIFKESGFLYFPPRDSVEQFTLKHSKITQHIETDETQFINHFLGKLKNESFENYGKKYLIDSVLLIGKQKFAVIAYMSFDTLKKATVQILNAGTLLKGNIIEVFFEFRKSYNDTAKNDFINSSFNALRSIKFL